jgi:electron transfer flavoprotein beta subunit
MNPTTQPLNLVVCVKPVPDPARWDKLKLDPKTMLLRRGDVPSVLNPLDRHALEQAVRLREERGGTVSVVMMAPPDAEEQLLEALAMGGDRACLLTDPAFAGADSLATARCLAAAVRRLGPFDLVCCGASSLDGSTSQVGPQIAELLDVPDLTHVTALAVEGGALRACCRVGGGDVTLEAELPVVVTFDKEINAPRLPSMRGIMSATRADVVRWGAADLGLDPANVGLAGSPTRMRNVFTAPPGRKGELIEGTPNQVAATLVDKLRSARLIG